MPAQLNSPDIKEAQLNRSQGLIHLINANVTICTWPRAGGKTSGGIGPRVLHLSEVMPRAQVLLMSDTYERIQDVTLPGLESFLKEELGMLPDVDYVSGKKPPEHWQKPLFVPKDYEHVTTFATGFSLCEVSMNKTGSAAGFNAQAAIGDEWKYVNAEKFKAEVRPAIRGAKRLYGQLAEFQSIWLFSDKFPTKGADIRWMLDQRKEVNQEDVDIIYTLQLEVLRLQKEIDELSSNEAIYKRQKMIRVCQEVMTEKRKDLVYFSDALPYENMENLGEKYFRDLKRDLSAYEYEIAIENKDPNRAVTPFYADLSKQHFYKRSNDYNPNKALIITLDYQFSITPLVCAQFDRLDGSPYTTLNFIQSMHSLHPESIDATCKKFCDAFEDHIGKDVYYIYNHTAIGRSPYGTTFKDSVIKYMEGRGWNVVEVYTGDAPDHDIKYEVIKKWLNCNSDRAIRINEIKNPFLKKALELTSVVISNGKTKKDKSGEKNNKIPPEEATHYPDAFDDLVWGANELDLVPMSEDPGLDISVSK
jgi:hypothetical protein